MRWFLRGEVALDVVARGPGRRRTDAYHLPSLSPAYALKRRGAPVTWECKQRVGRVEWATWCGASGFVECWVKQRVPKRRHSSAGAWRNVTKELWLQDGVEIGRVDIDGDVVWTFCVDVDRAAPPTGAAAARWRSLLWSADPMSYPSFVMTPTSRPTSSDLQMLPAPAGSA